MSGLKRENHKRGLTQNSLTCKIVVRKDGGKFKYSLSDERVFNIRGKVMTQSVWKPAFVEVEGKTLPDVRKGFGREQYRTNGEHPQCQPRIPPDELKEKRRAFFEGLYGRKGD